VIVSNRDREQETVVSCFPPTPPDVRVRIRRFGELRLARSEWRDAKAVEIGRGKSRMQGGMASYSPPVAGEVRRDRRHRALPHPPSALQLYRIPEPLLWPR
jgi:hypothetical protein